MVTNLKSAVEYIRENRGLKELRVSKRALDQIRKELEGMSLIQEGKRPTYGPPYGDVDRMLWDTARAVKKLSEIKILGVPVKALTD